MNDHDYAELEKLLNDAAPEADQNFRLLLRHQVMNAVDVPQPARRKRPAFWGRLRLWQPVVGVFLLLFLFFALTPTGRSWAQQVLNLGIFYVTNEPTYFETAVNNPELLDEENSVPVETVNVEPDQATDLAGFTVYYPNYIPDGYIAIEDPAVELILNSSGAVSGAEAMFVTADEDEFILYYAQSPFPADETLDSRPLEVGDATVDSVTVEGNEALWLTDYVWGTELVGDDPTELQTVLYNVLMWTVPNPDGGKFYFWLGSEAQLPFEEMIQIAESMTTE